MNGCFGARVALLGTLIGALPQVGMAADLPLPPDFHAAPPTSLPAGPPYNRNAARYYCRLAVEHPPFPRIPFVNGEADWVVKCTNRFLDAGRSAGKRAETLVCEMRAIDVLTEAGRYGIGSQALPTLSSVLSRCEREFRADALHLPPLKPAAARPPERSASFDELGTRPDWHLEPPSQP
jgi:hypothetical protein